MPGLSPRGGPVLAAVRLTAPAAAAFVRRACRPRDGSGIRAVRTACHTGAAFWTVCGRGGAPAYRLGGTAQLNGRHSAGRVAGRRRTTTGLHKAPVGARKAPPEARKASPVRVGGVKIAGRRVADGNGRPAVLTALGSGERLFAVLPLAILSVGSVAGLAAMINDDAAVSRSPADSGTAAGSIGHETASRRVPARVAPSPAPTAISPTPSLVGTGASRVPGTTDEASTDGSTGSLAATPAATDVPAAVGPATPAPTSSTTTTPDPAGSNSLTEAQATAHCVQSGISTTDVLTLGACVRDLLG